MNRNDGINEFFSKYCGIVVPSVVELCEEEEELPIASLCSFAEHSHGNSLFSLQGRCPFDHSLLPGWNPHQESFMLRPWQSQAAKTNKNQDLTWCSLWQVALQWWSSIAAFSCNYKGVHSNGLPSLKCFPRAPFSTCQRFFGDYWLPLRFNGVMHHMFI